MANFDGKYSCSSFEKGKKCRKCRKEKVYYTGSSVVHGNPFTPAADTEVDHYYQCKNCQYEWVEYA